MIVVGRIVGWILLVLGLMVLVRDGLLWLDTGRFIPLTVAEAWTLAGYFGRFRAAMPEGPAAAIWIGLPLVLAGALLLILCRRRRRSLFG